MKAVASRDNPSFKALRKLAEDAREIRRTGQTLIDGPHLVGAYLDAGGRPAMLVVSESGAVRLEISQLLDRCSEVPVLQLRDALFAEISGVAHPVGILALIAIPPEASGALVGSCVLLENVQDAGNVGAILRSAAAAGIGDAFLGAGCAGAWLPRVLRAAQGAHFQLRIRENAELAAVAAGFPGMIVATVVDAGQTIYDLDLRGPVAWLFGNEGAGLSADLAGRASVRAGIPLAPGSESLNVAAAAAVCFFEAVRQSRQRGRAEISQNPVA